MTDRLYLLDTNVVLALVRGKELGKRIDEQFGLRKLRQRPLISVVTVAEMRVLAARNHWGGPRLAALQSSIDNLAVVDIHHPAVLDAYVALDLRSAKHPAGARNMGKNDLWIAACAKAAGATLLTTDDDFSHLVPEHLDAILIR